MKPKKPHSNRRRRPTAYIEVEIIFEDEEIIVVSKPAGLLTIATEREKDRTVYALLFDHVKHHRPPEKVFIVHRLDREASGLLVFAKTEAAKYSLQQQFKLHQAGRTYWAVVEGRLATETCTLQSYLAENAAHQSYSTDARKGKLAITHVKVLKRSRQSTLVEVNLETGRKHQIRLHLAEQGHVIVGDRTYGSTRNPMGRLLLHAVRLNFRHPRTDQPLEFHSPAPSQFASLP
jgi:23S rRNA pseudouridine1911/1915/1917 synthase